MESINYFDYQANIIHVIEKEINIRSKWEIGLISGESHKYMKCHIGCLSIFLVKNISY